MRSFNGAAPARARNEILARSRHLTMRFNGAAPARARNATLSWTSGAGDVQLQRGRARAGAECADNCTLLAPRARPCFNGAAPARARNAAKTCIRAIMLRSASTGPRPRGRGMAPGRAQLRRHWRDGFNGAAPARARNVHGSANWQHRADMASTGPRPRGRGMTIAGMRRPLRIRCFNGAAPARARNDRCHGYRGHISPTLQRGRARAGAECRSTPCSMQLIAALQRGRARAGAEWPMVEGRRRHILSFNGAAPARARNGHPAISSSSMAGASTGPRPRGRGM